MNDSADHTPTGAGAAGTAGIVAFGLAVRAARKRLTMSVQELATRAGVSLGLVSQLERGLGNPSMHSVQSIASALGVPLTQLLAGPQTDLAVVRAQGRGQLPPLPDVAAQAQPVRELLTPPDSVAIQVIRTTLPPGFSNQTRPFRHIGTEAITVVSGELLVVHGDVRIELGTGDSATYRCSSAHWWANPTDTETVVIGAVVPTEH